MFLRYKNENGLGHYDCNVVHLDYTENNPNRGKLLKKTIAIFAGIILLIFVKIFVINIVLNQYEDSLDKILGGIVFIIVITTAFYYFFLETKRRKKHCNYSLQAEVFDVRVEEEHREHGGTYLTYTPVYKYNYLGKEYITEITLPTGDKELGNMEMIHINPNNPLEIYVDEEDDTKFGTIFTVLFAFCLFGCCLIFSGLNEIFEFVDFL